MAEKKAKKSNATPKPRQLKPAKVEAVTGRSVKVAKVKPEKLAVERTGFRALLYGFFAPLRFVGRVLKWLGRHIIPKYFRNSFAELKLVTWPNRKTTRQLTSAVILFAIVFAAFVSSLDFGLDKIFKRILLK